ncbi:MAG: hypothetical protein ABIJ09_07790 [Pseudomonadota bacterium]
MRISMIATTPLLTLALLLGGCAGSDSLLLAVANVVNEGEAAAAGSTVTCTVNEALLLPQGLLDIEATIEDTTPTYSGQNYIADLLVNWGAEANGRKTTETESFSNYGSVSTTDLIVEEVEVGYDFSYAPMEPPTATSVIPQRVALPVFAWLGEQQAKGLVRFEMVSRAVASAIEQDTADPTFGELLTAPNLYPMAVRFRLRARTEAGYRVETDDFSYPILLCKNCSVKLPPTHPKPACAQVQPCYPEWQNQFQCL